MGTSEGVWPHYINYNFAAQQLQLEDNNQFSPGQHAQGYPRLPPSYKHIQSHTDLF